MEQKDDGRWPVYYSDTIHVGNLDSENAILCLWTKKERILDKLDKDRYCFIGQLYSKEYGLQILVRNLLANPHVRNLIVVGIDLNESSSGLVNFFTKGVEEDNRVKDTDVFLDDQIKPEHIAAIRERVTFHDLRHIKDFSKLDKYLKKIKKINMDGERIIVPLPKISPPIRFPTDFSGFKARGRDFYSAYRNLISFVLKFGIYDPEKRILEAPNITFFVTKFSVQDKAYLHSGKLKASGKNKISAFQYDGKQINTVFFKRLEVWEELKGCAKRLDDLDNLCFFIARAYIEEKDIEDAVEMVGASEKSLKWDPDPNGNLIIRVEEEMIKTMHVSQNGTVLEEFSATNARDIFAKIIEGNKISIFYHALDIGAELQKAEIALKEGKKYVQDRKF